jgi:cytochrome oxidase Cu insertion factor (SCO1/SenC/PrrC family)
MIRNAVQLAVCAAALAAAACSGQEAAVETAANAVAHAESASHDSAKDHSAGEAKRQSGHDTHSYVMPDISEMTGSIKLVNAKTGGTFTEQDLLGSWTLLYLGYIECLEACPIAMASMPKAVDQLNAMGVPTKAVFIDINAPRLDDLSGGLAHSKKTGAASAAPHDAHAGGGKLPVNELATTGPEIRRQAIATWGESQDPDVILLSGSRKQVMDAGRLFKSRAEQTMMPTKESIHHINHTTYVYALNPKGDVVVLLYHSDSPQMMVDEVAAAANAAPSAG